MKITLALNSFKGTLTSREANSSLARGLRNGFKNIEIDEIQLSDGGDGFIEVMKEFEEFSIENRNALNPHSEIIRTEILINKSKNTVLIESANIIGLKTCKKVNFSKSNSHGLGILIKELINDGYKNFIIGIGGTAITDVGLGIIQELGLKILNSDNKEIFISNNNLDQIARFDTTQLKDLKTISFKCFCDANTSLDQLRTYLINCKGKGANKKEVIKLEKSIPKVLNMIRNSTTKDFRKMDRVGCGGGSAYSFYAFLNAKLFLGADEILHLQNFEKRVKDTDLVITGEGLFDEVTFLGKLPNQVLKKCLKINKKVIVISPQYKVSYNSLFKAGFSGAFRTELDAFNINEIIKDNSASSRLEDFGKIFGKFIYK